MKYFYEDFLEIIMTNYNFSDKYLFEREMK